MDPVPFETLRGKCLVVQEKVDGANVGISFDDQGKLQLQSRGHFLTGGPRERQFDLLKVWAQTYQAQLARILANRYVLYGEWLYAKHHLFYDLLPHYFLAFDILDTQYDLFFSIERCRNLLSPLPIVWMPTLAVRQFATLDALTKLLGPSQFQSSSWRKKLTEICQTRGLDQNRISWDHTDLMEGLYIRVEESGQVTTRCKFVRQTFVDALGEHWSRRPLIPNRLDVERERLNKLLRCVP